MTNQAAHEWSERRTPISVIVRCSCGWSATQTRRQNAFARAAKLRGAWTSHLDEMNQAAQAGVGHANTEGRKTSAPRNAFDTIAQRSASPRKGETA